MILKVVSLFFLLCVIFAGGAFSQVSRDIDPISGEVTLVTDRFQMQSESNSIIRAEGGFAHLDDEFLFTLAFVNTRRIINFERKTNLNFQIDQISASAKIALNDQQQVAINNTNYPTYVVISILNKDDLTMFRDASILQVEFDDIIFRFPQNTSYYIDQLFRALN